MPRGFERRSCHMPNGEIDPYVKLYRARCLQRAGGSEGRKSWEALNDKQRSGWRKRYVEFCRDAKIDKMKPGEALTN